MKRIIIIVPHKKLYRAAIYLLAFLLLVGIVSILKIIPADFIPAFLFDRLEENEIQSLEKENSKLDGLSKRIIPVDNEMIFEDQYRNRFLNAKDYTPPEVQSVPLPQVLKKGKYINFKILKNEPGYLRPLYNPDWKGFFFRGWLYLPRKNIEARHRLFIYPFGGSSIFDFTGTLGLEDGIAVNYHRNINFLVYDFNVKGIRWYGNQAALTGETARTGLQIISVVQDDLLPEGLDKNEILFQLSTPEGYEIDYDCANVIRYEYLFKKNKENRVKDAYLVKSLEETIDKLLEENLKLKKEIANFTPFEDKVIYQNKCKPIPPNFPLDPDIETTLKRGKVLKINKIYSNKKYERPVYDPAWYENREHRWCFIPKQICNNLHRLFLIPQNTKDRLDFFGMLGFHEMTRPVDSSEYGFIVYNFKTERAIIYEDQLLFVGSPSRTGAEIITIGQSDLPGSDKSMNNQSGNGMSDGGPTVSDAPGNAPSGSDPPGKGFYIARLVTPDYQEMDYVIMK